MKRKVIGNVRPDEYLKEASSFIYDNTLNSVIVPEYIRITDEQAYKFYRSNEWVNATVNRIVDDCVKIKPKVVLKDKTKELRPRHRRVIEFLEDMFKRVNDNEETLSSLREKFIKDMLIYGRGVIEKVLDDFDTLKELYSVRASSIEIMANEHGLIPKNKAYRQKNKKGEYIYFSKDEIIWTVFRPISGSLCGEKPLDVLANAVASDILRCVHNSNYFINGAKMGGILSLEGMSKLELKKFRQYVRENHKGAKNAHRLLAVNVPIRYISDVITNKDMEFTEYGKELRTKIFAVYSMQPFIMGIIDSNTGKLNSGQQVEIYKDGALKPILRKEAEVYTKEILEDGLGLKEFQIEFEGIDLADTITQAEIDRMDINSGILTINEVRQRRGLQPVPWGNTPISILPGGNQIDPETGRIIPPSQQNENNNEDK